MKKILLLCLLTVTLFSQSVIKKIYYDTGELHYEATFKDNSLNGITKVYYKTGELKSEIMYKNDKPNGTTKDYYKIGELMSEIIYKNGKAVSGFMYESNGRKTKLTHVHFHKMGLKY